MNILFIGDIFARPGRSAIQSVLKKYRQTLQVDLVIANAENLSHGKGVQKNHLKEMQDAGVDFFTSGNHVYDQKEIIPFLADDSLPLLRPANYPKNAPGRGFQVITTAAKEEVLIINLMGRVFMPMHLDCPFRAADEILEQHEHKNLAAIFIDFHAEATSEKAALAWYLDGRVSAVIGTHTHVPTADARILPQGAAFQSDVGFTGPLDSILGVTKEPIIEKFLTQIPVKHTPATSGPSVFNATLITIDPNTRKTTALRTLQEILE